MNPVDPDSLAAALRGLAAYVEESESPSRSAVRRVLEGNLELLTAGAAVPGYSLVPAILSIDVSDEEATNKAIHYLNSISIQ